MPRDDQNSAAGAGSSAEPFLVNVADDPLLSGMLVYPLQNGDTSLGSAETCDIVTEDRRHRLHFQKILSTYGVLYDLLCARIRTFPTQAAGITVMCFAS